MREGRPPKYESEVEGVQWRIWKVAEQPCGKRLKALLPQWLPHYESEYGELEKDLRSRVLSICVAQIDRLLSASKSRVGHRGCCGTKPGGLLKTQIPIRTENWGITRPGVWEADTGAHWESRLEGPKVERGHDKPLTPCERLLGIPEMDAASKRKLWDQRAATPKP